MSLFQGTSHELNATHKAFVERLEQVVRTLKPLKAVEMVDGTTHDSSSATKAREANVFTSLEPEPDTVSESDLLPHDGTMETVIEASEIAQDAPILDDDELGQWIELSFFIYVSQALNYDRKGYWEEAAKGLMPITLAAALSTFTLHAVDRTSQGRARLAADATEFTNKWMYLKQHQPKLRFTAMPELTRWSGGLLDDQMEFSHVHRVIHHMQRMEEYRVIEPTAGESVSPVGEIQRTRPSNETDARSLNKDFDKDDWALDKMQESMRQLLQTGRAIASLENPNDHRSVCEALLPMVRSIEANADAPIPISLVFGMEMLLSTFKAFMWPGYTLNKANCRLKVLMFAKKVEAEIKATIREMHASANSQHHMFVIGNFFLEQRLSHMDGIIKEKRFDLHYQAPWTAGSHINEILDAVRFDGANLCFHTGYLCAVLHLYNALKAVSEPKQEITLLERLCIAYIDLLFLGTLPTENFSSHYRRARGKGFGRDQETGRTDYSRLAASDRGGRNEQSIHVCLFSELYNNYHQPDITFWTKVYCAELTTRPTESQKRSVIHEVHSKPFNVALDRVKHRLLQDFQGDLPLAQLNNFAVFRLCLKILTDLGSKIRPDSDGGMSLPDCAVGFSAVDDLLEQLVAHLRDDGMKRLSPYWRPLNRIKEVFKNAGSGLKMQGFLWSL